MSPVAPPAQPSIRIVRTSPYKGGTRNWGQRFYFTGANFTTAQFVTLRDWLNAHLAGQLMPESNIVEQIGYNIGSDVPVFTTSVVVAGSVPSGGGDIMPLEVCALARLSTTQRTSKNHPIYGFKYYHNVQHDGGADHELLRVSTRTGISTNLGLLLAGVSDGSTTRQWCDRRGAVFQAVNVSSELTHRDFPK